MSPFSIIAYAEVKRSSVGERDFLERKIISEHFYARKRAIRNIY